MMILTLFAAAALPTVAGVELGAPPSIPECARMALSVPLPNGMKPAYLMQDADECVMLPDKGAANDTGLIFFPATKMPLIASFNYVSFTLIDGKIEALNIATLDHNHADAIVAQLVEKFGKPTADAPGQAIVEHIAVPDRRVTWRGDGWRATYESIHTMERGSLRVETDVASAAVDAANAKMRSDAAPL